MPGNVLKFLIVESKYTFIFLIFLTLLNNALFMIELQALNRKLKVNLRFNVLNEKWFSHVVMNRVILDSTNDVVFWIDFLSIQFNINLCAVYIWTYYRECEILCSSNVFLVYILVYFWQWLFQIKWFCENVLNGISCH